MLVDRVFVLYLYMYITATLEILQQTYPRLFSRSNFMRTHKSICVGVNMTISRRYLGVREWRIHTHYHVTCHKIGGGNCIQTVEYMNMDPGSAQFSCRHKGWLVSMGPPVDIHNIHVHSASRCVSSVGLCMCVCV